MMKIFFIYNSRPDEISPIILVETDFDYRMKSSGNGFLGSEQGYLNIISIAQIQESTEYHMWK